MRINLLGGPGVGKSTTAAWLFAELKRRNYSIELVSEYVKAWAIAKRAVIGFDQVYLMGKQMNYEYRFLANGIRHIVTDSPVILSPCYARLYAPDLNIAEGMESIVQAYEDQMPSLNIVLDRDGKPYKTEGRYQTEEEAKAIDSSVKDMLSKMGIRYTEISFYDTASILKHVVDNLE